jgi:hypothetical protein
MLQLVTIEGEQPTGLVSPSPGYYASRRARRGGVFRGVGLVVDPG